MNSWVAGWMPLSPWIGSSMMAAVEGVTASASASTSLNGMYLKPGGRGSKPFWYFGWPVAVMAARVRPWKESTAVSISGCSMPRIVCAHLRASLMAVSFASAPEFTKKARVQFVVCASSAASRPW